MQLPANVLAIRDRYVAAFPVPHGEPGEAFEEQARRWSIRFAEQVAYDTGDGRWGMKRADPNRPISKDTIAFTDDGRLFIWDLLLGTGTGAPRLVDNPHSEELFGQVFVPVAARNHLGTASPTPVPPAPVPVPLPPADLGPVMTMLAAIQAQQQAAVENMAALARESEQRHAELLTLLQQLDAKELTVTLPDGVLRIGRNAVGVVDFPGN